jgi:hypothetical protein
MKLLLLFGNCAAGKMTVGQELTKITPFRLFHNHMMIEPVLEVFGDFNVKTIFKLRDVVFEEFAKTDHYGLIFTFMWAFDRQEDWDYIAHVKDCFGLKEEDIYYVELVASQETRLLRNVSENRLLHKQSKRNIGDSNQRLLDDDRRYRLESLPGEIPFANYLRLNNEAITAAEAAGIIKDHFHLHSVSC